MRTFNREIDQDRVADAFDLFNKCGQVMFHQQKMIYENLRHLIRSEDVLEAGCGMGLGTAILERSAGSIVGTDKLARNVAFARCLYPWIAFEQWDLNLPYPDRADVVVAIEVVEHVGDTKAAIRNLLAAAKHELIISVPNGTNKPCPPDNPYHVCERTPREMLDLLGEQTVSIHHWQTMERLDVNTLVDPLVYWIVK